MKTPEYVDAFGDGWFWFCPCYFSWHGEDIAPIPKLRMWWLFELAVLWQQAVNYCIPEECAGFVFKIYDFATPKRVRSI